MNSSQLSEQPNSIEAECSVLGECILNSEALTSAMELLKPDDFFDYKNRLVFQTMSDMFYDNVPVDYLTLAEKLKTLGVLERLGGMCFIDNIAATVTTTANVHYHVGIVREYSRRRKLLNAASTIAQLAVDYEKDVPAIIDEAEKLLFDSAQNKSSAEFLHVREVIAPMLGDILEQKNSGHGKLLGYSTGLTDLDAILGGLEPGSLNIIAARPSMGKTALALNIAQFGGHNGKPVLIFSLEMPAEHIIQRMISAESRISLSYLRNGTLTANEFKAVKEACDKIAQSEFYINDATMLSAIEFRARCRRFKIQHPELALVVVDYLQLMSSGEKRSEGRQQEVSDISRMLKAAARELNCPVIALSQLSRQAENRSDKKPQLSDLRDSGAIEQDADTVMMLYREDYYSEHENNDLTDSKAELRVAKNRNGGTGVAALTFKREITRFLNHGEE